MADIRTGWVMALLAVLWSILLTGESLSADPPDRAARGKSIYNQLCLKCHGSDGRAEEYRNLTPPPVDLTSPSVQNKLDATLFRSVHEGRKNTAMGAWKHALKDEEINDVLAYVRQLGGTGKTP